MRTLSGGHCETVRPTSLKSGQLDFALEIELLSCGLTIFTLKSVKRHIESLNFLCNIQLDHPVHYRRRRPPRPSFLRNIWDQILQFRTYLLFTRASCSVLSDQVKAEWVDLHE